MNTTTFVAGAMVLSALLLVTGFVASVRGRRGLCACSVLPGLVLTGLIIHAGLAGGLAVSGQGVFGLSAVVTAKLAVGLALLLFAVAWVTVFTPRKQTAAVFGLPRRLRRRTTTGRHPVATRRESRPSMPAQPSADVRP